MSNHPTRIQRKRTKGWKMPPNTVYVGRPTIFANSFRVGRDGNSQECVDLFRKSLEGYPNAGRAFSYFLRGKNLACWCRLDQPCHADVLLEIANGEQE